MKYGTKIRGDFPFGEYKEGMTGLEFVRTGFDNFKHWDRPMLCQEKLDGWFGVVIRGDGDCYWDNGWKEYHVLQAMLPGFKKFMPRQSILVGEVGYGTQTETARANRVGHNRFVAFDVLLWDGEVVKNRSNGERFKFLCDKVFQYSFPMDHGSLISIADTLVLNEGAHTNRIRAWDTFVGVVEQRGEGIVLKDYDGEYVLGGESTSMRKVKKFLTKDYVCLGFTVSSAPTFVEQGMTVSSMECGLYVDGKLKHVTTTSGFDFMWRKMFTENPSQYMGKVVELGGFEVFKTGAMRHSSFLRFREDRVPADCIL